MRMHSSHKLKKHYNVGDLIEVKVIERVDNTAWIVSLQGMLIQVRNSTTLSLKEGDTVRMRLVSLDPPQLSCI